MLSMGNEALHIVSDTEDYAELMASHQARLESFIRALTGDADAARDILQETNVILLRKARDFEPGTNFSAWAFRIARFEVMTWRKKLGRSRLTFNDELVDSVADTAETLDDTYAGRVEALRECIRKLPERQREIVRLRYLEEWSVADLAEKTGDKANAVSQLLFRARQNLLRCVEKTMQREVS